MRLFRNPLARPAGRTPARRPGRRAGCTWGCLTRAVAVLVGLVLLLAIVASLAPRPPGPESGPPPTAPPTPTAIPPDRRLIFTYYFYWYDATSGAHLREEDGQRYHLPATPAPSWRSVEWHKKQLADMAYAGIDVVLPVYWGFDRRGDEWSWQGLAPLAQAWQQLRAEGTEPPRIGFFLDTAIVDWRDLTSDAGKEWYYANFKDFFTRIPRDQWALINGQPVAFTFTSDFTGAVDQTTFDHVYERFRADFGVRPYVVREASWGFPILRWEQGRRVRDFSRPIATDNIFLWGAAIRGYADYGGVAAVGPGFDDRRVPGRGQGTVTERQDGAFYRRAFEAAIASGKPLLAIETWNEMHEGSGICETVEYGRQYIELTRELAAAFHRRR